MKEEVKNNSIKSDSDRDIIKTLKKGATLGIGALNGIVGDYLENEKNGLSVQMQFYANGKPLAMETATIQQVHKKPTSKICILIHGLTNDETIWNFSNETDINYGTLLQNELDFTPFYIRYNTGIHISENGKQFSQLIENLCKIYPVEIEEIVIIAHSMGGLVSRSACHYAPLQGSNWTDKLSKLFFIGTPHLGAPLEKFGNILTNLLKSIPVSYTQLAGDIINLRSAGIKDLRYGYLTDEDWKNQHPDELLKNNKTVIPLLENADYYLISGSLTKDANHLASEWFGDALVRKESAIGKSRGKHHIPFDLKNHKEFPGTTHLKLVDSPEIYNQIKCWITEKPTLIKSPEIRIENKIERNEKQHLPEKNMGNKSQLKGAFQLATTGVLEGINKLGWLNKNSGRTTYKILNQIPVISVFSQEIESIQHNITEFALNSSKTLVKKADEMLKKQDK